jgi:hypothetical protein
LPGILWNEAYLQPGGLDDFIASGSAPGPEVILINNGTKPPKTIQWTLGLRQQFGSWLGSLSYASVEGNNSFAYAWAAQPPGVPYNKRWAGLSVNIPGYGLVMRSFGGRKTDYDGVYLTFDKPYTSDSKWGANFAYTYSKGQQQASTDEGYAFGFDSWPPGNWTFFPANGDARHRFIASGTVGLPLGFRVSSIITLASPTVFTYTDCNSVPSWDDCVDYLNGWRGTKQSFLGLEEFGYRSVDLRVEWEARLGGDFRLGLVAEAFNVFNYSNYNGFDLWLGAPGETPNPKFGQPTSAYNARRYQFGVRFGF